MITNQTVYIKGSVGQGGINNSFDVQTIQRRLNEIMPISRMKLQVDGRVGRKTVLIIKDFQRTVVGFRYPDGRIDIKARSIRALNDFSAIAKWAKICIPPEHPTLPLVHIPYENEVIKIFKFSLADFHIYRKALVDGSIPDMKIFLGLIDSPEKMRGITIFYIEMLKLYEIKEIHEIYGSKRSTQIIKTIVSIKDPEIFEIFSKNSSKLVESLQFTGKVAGEIGYVITFIEVANKFIEGDYLYGVAELYKIYMGKMLPWAGILDAMLSLIEAVVPLSISNSTTFKILRVCDPVGLGAVGIDAIGTLALGLIDMMHKGTINIEVALPRIRRLVLRMKQSGPTKIFVELGLDSGDACYQISNWKRGDWNYAIKSVPAWLDSVF